MGQLGPRGFPPHMVYRRVLSVLGSLLYIIYTSDLATLLAFYSALAQLYADDVQAYLHCSPSDAIATTRVMSSIMRALETWMSSNRLRLNSAKTQFIWLGTRQQLARLDMADLSDAFPLLTFSSAVRELGVTMGCQLTFATHINLLSRDCFYQLRQLRTVTRSLTPSATSTLVHAFVANRLDYCCSFYAGLPACRLGSFDRVLSSAARLIGGIPKFGHVSQYMLDVLHWQRISYRIASLVWCCLVGLASVYLRELCCHPLSAMSSRSFRSSQQGLLLVPFARTSTEQIRAFSVVVPSTWNGLPSELRIFNRTTLPAFFSHLKNALFDRAGVESASE